MKLCTCTDFVIARPCWCEGRRGLCVWERGELWPLRDISLLAYMLVTGENGLMHLGVLMAQRWAACCDPLFACGRRPSESVHVFQFVIPSCKSTGRLLFSVHGGDKPKRIAVLVVRNSGVCVSSRTVSVANFVQKWKGSSERTATSTSEIDCRRIQPFQTHHCML